jgi:F-type H+-transporting ATPase subunit delta
MSEAITIARPYAQAAFDFAKQKGDLKSWSELLTTAAAAVGDVQVAALIVNPQLTTKQLQELMHALTGDAAGHSGQNFMRLLIEEHRLAVLPEIAEQFERLRAEEEKSVDVEVSSAFALDDAHQQKIAAALKVRLGRDIRLHCKVDPALVGGAVIRAGDQVIDGSVRTRLAEMTSALA